MAVKAVIAINSFDVTIADGSYHVWFHLWTDRHEEPNIPNDAEFDLNTISATVNAALKAYAQSFCERQWGIEFDPLVDTVTILSPVSVL